MEELNRMTKEQLEDELTVMRKKAMTSRIVAGCAAVAAFLTIITELLIIILGFLATAVVFGIRAALAAKRVDEIKKRLRNMAATDQVDDEFQSMRTKVLILRILTYSFIAVGFISLFITQNVVIMVGFWLVALAFGIPAGRAIRKRNAVKESLGEHVLRSVVRNVLGNTAEFVSGELKPDKEAAPFCFPIRDGKVWETRGKYQIKAAYHGVNMQLGTVYINEKESGWEWDEASCGYTLFHGPWLICDFGRKPACTVSVSSRNGLFSKEKNAVPIDNEQLSKRFCVNARVSREAFAILTPQMMEAISAVADKSGGSIYISFMPDGKTHIGIDVRRTYFVAGKCNDAELLRQQFSEDLRRLTDIIDTLNV